MSDGSIIITRRNQLKNNHYRWLSLIAAFVLALTVSATGIHTIYAQGDSRTFPETGKTVHGPFLAYWNQHGGLAQQGFPISDELQQVSPTDGKTYTVQYFERAVFEEHPEFAGTPNEVLLSLLGVFRYQQKYPSGAPSQSPNNEINSQLFPQTGHRVGGKFLDYWNTHGGLAQQGFPISDEFIEISDLDGKPYKVQYFERAEFEEHPEFAGTSNEVLLSQLGTFAWQAKQAPPPQGATPVPPHGATPVPPAPTAVPPTSCDQGVPAAKDATVTPRCGPIGTVFQISAHGFTPNEQISFWLTAPDQSVVGTPRPLDIGPHPGSFNNSFDSSFLSSVGDQANGIWALTYEGKDSHHQSVVWFKIVSGSGGSAPTPTPAAAGGCSGIPASTAHIAIAPSNCEKAGVRFTFRAGGFQPGEKAGVYLTGPDQAVYGAPFQVDVDGQGTTSTVTLTTNSTFPKGVWAITFEGTSSHHKEIGYFKILP